MKVHHSSQSFFSAPIKSQQDSESSDDTPFTLPGDDSDDGEQSQALSISSSGIPSSISTGFWLNQAGDGSSSSSSSGSSGPSIDGSESSGDSANRDILDEFAKLANMTPAQKIREQYLEEHHLTEQSFSQLPADEQKAINDEIADEIKRKLGADNQTDSSDETDSAAAALSIA